MIMSLKTDLRRLAVAAVALGAALCATAEQWDLQRCIDYAVANNIDIARYRLRAASAEQDVTDARDRFLPTVGAYGNQNFSFGRGLTAENTYADRNTASTAFGASLQLPVFQGLAGIRRVDYAKASLAAVLEQAEAAKDDLTLNVITAYLQALYSSEVSAIARGRLAISRAEMERTEALVAAGRVAELDLAQARAQVAQDELSVVTAAGDSALAVLDLTQMLNLPSASGFEVVPLADENPMLMSAAEVFAAAMGHNHSLRAAELGVVAAERNISLARTGYIPTLSFNAGIGTNYYRTSGVPNEGFGAQMRHNFSQSIGFSLSVPIFDAFATRNSLRRANIAHLEAELQLDDSRNALFKAINQAHTRALAAVRGRAAAAVAVESSRAAFEAMQTKYELGRANATELEKARNDYTNALTEAARTKYEAILRTRLLNFYAGL